MLLPIPCQLTLADCDTFFPLDGSENFKIIGHLHYKTYTTFCFNVARNIGKNHFVVCWLAKIHRHLHVHPYSESIDLCVSTIKGSECII